MLGRYKGKREAPRGENVPGERELDPFTPGAGEKGDPFDQNVTREPAAGVGDPFAEGPASTESAAPEGEDPFEAETVPAEELGDPFAEETGGEGRKLDAFRAGCGRFFRSRKGKVITTVVCCLLAFVVGGTIALRGWIKPPEIPTAPVEPEETVPEQPEEPAEPTDDELYPDDGYTGDMPTVSGERKEGVYTFLLVGTDMGDGNTDTIMVATYDTKNQNVSIMSIPRDTMINASWDIKKINSVYSRYSDGIGALKTQISRLVGFTPDFYVKVELSMFVELVDLVGGVEFYVPQDMNYDDDWQDLHIHLEEGLQVLDGESAMELVRFRRYAEGDIKRVQVQQDFMKALIQECLSLEHWGKIKAYIDLAMENVETDLDFGSIVWFAAQALGLNGGGALDMDNVYTCTLPANYYASAWSRATSQEQSYVTIYPNQVVELVNERFNPYLQDVTTSMLDAMSILSNGDIASSTGSLRDTQHNAIMAVRRGEAYYDDNGNIVYGTPPTEPEVLQDELGNYYILDENGNIVYTDESGTPIQPALPPEGTGSEGTGDTTGSADGTGGTGTTDTGSEPTVPGDGGGTGETGGAEESAGGAGETDGGSGADGAGVPDSGTGDGAAQLPEEPDTPAEPSADEEPPGWL